LFFILPSDYPGSRDFTRLLPTLALLTGGHGQSPLAARSRLQYSPPMLAV